MTAALTSFVNRGRKNWILYSALTSELYSARWRDSRQCRSSRSSQSSCATDFSLRASVEYTSTVALPAIVEKHLCRQGLCCGRALSCNADASQSSDCSACTSAGMRPRGLSAVPHACGANLPPMPTFSRATLDLGSTETEVDGASVVVHEQRRTTALDMERRVVANRRSTSFKRSSSEEMGSDEDVLMQQSAYLRMIAYLRRSNIESGSSSELLRGTSAASVQHQGDSEMDPPSELSGSSGSDEDDANMDDYPPPHIQPSMDPRR